MIKFTISCVISGTYAIFIFFSPSFPSLTETSSKLYSLKQLFPLHPCHVSPHHPPTPTPLFPPLISREKVCVYWVHP